MRKYSRFYRNVQVPFASISMYALRLYTTKPLFQDKRNTLKTCGRNPIELASLRWLLFLRVTMLAHSPGAVEIERPVVVARSRRGEVERPWGGRIKGQKQTWTNSFNGGSDSDRYQHGICSIRNIYRSLLYDFHDNVGRAFSKCSFLATYLSRENIPNGSYR